MCQKQQNDDMVRLAARLSRRTAVCPGIGPVRCPYILSSRKAKPRRIERKPAAPEPLPRGAEISVTVAGRLPVNPGKSIGVEFAIPGRRQGLGARGGRSCPRRSVAATERRQGSWSGSVTPARDCSQRAPAASTVRQPDAPAGLSTNRPASWRY